MSDNSEDATNSSTTKPSTTTTTIDNLIPSSQTPAVIEEGSYLDVSFNIFEEPNSENSKTLQNLIHKIKALKNG